MIQVAVRKLQFSAGHRVYGHESVCAQCHGHNFLVELHAVKNDGGLDSIGRVVDFSVLKDKVGTWIDANWDHGFILFSDDGAAIKALTSIQGHKTFILPLNPTSENIASYLLEEVCPMVLKDTAAKVIKVVVHETPNCFAEVSDFYYGQS